MLQALNTFYKERYGIGFSAEAITWDFLANKEMILLLAFLVLWVEKWLYP